MGLVLIGVGGDLLFHDHYFMWPPGADTYINSDLIGGWGFLTGVGLGYLLLTFLMIRESPTQKRSDIERKE